MRNQLPPELQRHLDAQERNRWKRDPIGSAVDAAGSFIGGMFGAGRDMLVDSVTDHPVVERFRNYGPLDEMTPAQRRAYNQLPPHLRNALTRALFGY